MSIAHTWNATAEERRQPYRCDGLIAGKASALYRAIAVDAPAVVTFRWLCQLRAAPYSYDWIDNGGRRSPKELTPGLDELEVGQTVMRIFNIVSFERDRELTIVLRDRRLSRQIFGAIALTYAIQPVTDAKSRIIVKVVVRYPPAPHGWLVRALLPWGDLVMMRKQLMNLKRLAERDAAPA